LGGIQPVTVGVMLMRVCRLCGEKFNARADVDYCCAAHRQAGYRIRHRPPGGPTVAAPASVEEKLALIARLVDEVREMTAVAHEFDGMRIN
jgi:hypothetical protein